VLQLGIANTDSEFNESEKDSIVANLIINVNLSGQLIDKLIVISVKESAPLTIISLNP
jgi:hypothetical protein